MSTRIFVKFKILGTHHWFGANGDVEFLKNEHHHDFGFRVECNVSHDDRELEFIRLRTLCMNALTNTTIYPNCNGIVLFGNRSCEQIAHDLFLFLQAAIDCPKDFCRQWKITVDEDGTQGAIFEEPQQVRYMPTIVDDPNEKVAGEALERMNKLLRNWGIE